MNQPKCKSHFTRRHNIQKHVTKYSRGIQPEGDTRWIISVGLLNLAWIETCLNYFAFFMGNFGFLRQVFNYENGFSVCNSYSLRCLDFFPLVFHVFLVKSMLFFSVKNERDLVFRTKQTLMPELCINWDSDLYLLVRTLWFMRTRVVYLHCSSQLSSRYQFTETSVSSSALKKKDSVSLGLAIMV